MTDGSRGLLPPDPSFVPDEQEKDSPVQAIGFTAIMAFVILFAIFI